jgi:hypothetical protein
MPSYTVRVHRLDPTLAEVHIEFADLPPDAKVVGRVMGPRCPGVNTIEIAHKLQPLAHPVYRVLIPEPLRWSEEQPYVYEGPVEFMIEGLAPEKLWVSFGIKS